MHFVRVRACLTSVALLLLSFGVVAQRPPAQPNAAEILHRMQKLNVLGSVLYIAAHPDDENTRLIAWLANGKKVRTGYLSLTRGEGGQNLIGPELGDALGIIRTQELLEARRIDGGEQFFTRAVDFGYSKSAEESFEKWGRQEVLSDVVRVIRMFRPDVIITRFPPTREAGHGHHEASAILAREAFDLAGDPKAFPEQLEQGLEVWQPRRLFWNASLFWRQDLAEYVKKDSTGEWYSVDVGGYDPLLGLSYTEIAGRSRSMHKSQGFGAAETRGETIEYLHFEKGVRPKGKDIFEGIDMTWGRLDNHAPLTDQVSELTSTFDPLHPNTSLPRLLQIADAIGRHVQNKDSQWCTEKDIAIQQIRNACAGLSAQVIAPTPTVTTVDTAAASMTTIARGVSGLTLQRIKPSTWLNVEWSQEVSRALVLNQPISVRLSLDHIANLDQPFWLERPHGPLYAIADPRLIGAANIPHQLMYEARVGAMDSTEMVVEAPVMYKWVDRVAGERIRPVYITPVASVIPRSKVLLTRDTPKGTMVQIEVDVEALTDDLSGQLNVSAPKGWMVPKDLKLVNIARRNERQHFVFNLYHDRGWSADEEISTISFEFSGPKGKADRTLHEIDYPHIMPQVYYTPAEVKLIHADASTTASTVGYIRGAGDEVPEAIEQLGVKVEIIDPGTATLEGLRKYDAIVTGIRAYNTVKELKELNPVLMKYMEEGGTLVVQYNTLSRDMVLPDSLIGPYPFKLTRDRVTVEEASCTLLAQDHPLLTTPNRIDTTDFESWTQERGLYFCGDLDPRYTPLLSWNDPGEDPLNGALITCDYGKGRYIYTGISFFRQLPAGVPGAYRLFANLISPRKAH